MLAMVLWNTINETDRERLAVVRRPLIILALLTVLILAGTLGFRFTTEASWLESLYFAVITLTTLGCRDPALNQMTMMFVVVYLGCGLGLFSFSLFTFGQSLMDPQFRLFWKQRRMKKRIDGMSGHHIVCGFGRMGKTICEYLHHRNREFVVIDNDSEIVEHICEAHGWTYIVGDSTDDENLRAAGIDRAIALASVLPSDADNTYVVLSARMLNSEIQIVARASDEKAIQKIERAGATRVISPFSSGGMKMARFMINPSVESFVDVADEHDNDLEMVEVQISKTSTLVGKKLSQTRFADHGVMILAIRRENGETVVPPPGNAVLHADDNLYAFGQTENVARLIQLCDQAQEVS